MSRAAQHRCSSNHPRSRPVPRFDARGRPLAGWPTAALACLLAATAAAAAWAAPPAGAPPASAPPDSAPARGAPPAVPIYGYDVVHAYPHDTHAFTEGLFYLDGYLYESTGLQGQSSIRKEQLASGQVIQRLDIPARYFGEGIVNWDDRLVELTWQAQVGFVYDLATLRQQRQFSYEGEGWGLTQNGRWLIMSDGTPELRYLDPQTLGVVGKLLVTYEGMPLRNLNELEWVRGEIYANVWETDWIVRIDPDSGAVVGLIDLRGLLPAADHVPGQTDVLNGIAYDARGNRLFVTGKNWPKLFQIRLHRKGPEPPFAP